MELKKLDNTRTLETKNQREEKERGNLNPSKVPKLPPFEECTDDMDAYLYFASLKKVWDIAKIEQNLYGSLIWVHFLQAMH